MNYSESYYMSQFLALTNSLIGAGINVDDAPSKAQILFKQVRTLAEQEAQDEPLPDPQEQALLKQEQVKLDLQAYYDAKKADYERRFDKDQAIDYDQNTGAV